MQRGLALPGGEQKDDVEVTRRHPPNSQHGSQQDKQDSTFPRRFHPPQARVRRPPPGFETPSRRRRTGFGGRTRRLTRPGSRHQRETACSVHLVVSESCGLFNPEHPCQKRYVGGIAAILAAWNQHDLAMTDTVLVDHSAFRGRILAT